MFWLVVVYLVLTLGDVWTTALGFEKLQRNGFAQEMNPVARWAFNTIGFLPTMIIKTILACLVGLVLYRHEAIWVGIIINVGMAYVVAHNFYISVFRDGYPWHPFQGAGSQGG